MQPLQYSLSLVNANVLTHTHYYRCMISAYPHAHNHVPIMVLFQERLLSFQQCRWELQGTPLHPPFWLPSSGRGKRSHYRERGVQTFLWTRNHSPLSLFFIDAHVHNNTFAQGSLNILMRAVVLKCIFSVQKRIIIGLTKSGEPHLSLRWLDERGGGKVAVSSI